MEMSTTVRTVAREYYSKTRLGASFCFSRRGEDISHAGEFVGSVAAQLTQKSPAPRDLLRGAISKDVKMIFDITAVHVIFRPFVYIYIHVRVISKICVVCIPEIALEDLAE